MLWPFFCMLVMQQTQTKTLSNCIITYMKQNKTIRPLFLFLIGFLLAFVSNGQVQQIDRIEIPVSKDYSIRAVYNFGADGLLVSTKELRDKSKRDPDRVFRHYNSNLEEVGSYNIEVPFRQKFAWSYEADSSVFILNHDTKFGDFTLIELRAKDLSESRIKGKFPPRTTVKRMFCYQNFTVFYAYIGKRKQKLFILDRSNGNLTDFDLKAESRKKMFSDLDVHVADDGNSAYMMFEICTKKRCDEYLLYVFDSNGEFKVTPIDPGENRIISATMTTLNDGEFILAGTYSDRPKGSGKGMFISHYQNGQQQYFNTFPFTGFENFFDYLSDRQKRRLDRIKRRREQRGRELEYSIRMVLHEVIEIEGQYIVVGEAYYPTYRSETRTTAQGTTVTYTVFDGYQYSHATLAAFSKQGEKLYDNTFTMFLYDKPYSVKRFIEVGVDGKQISMVYVDDKFIRTKIFEDGDVVEEENSELMETGREGDRVRGTTSELEFWYDQYFVSYGYQYIKNKQDKSVKKRRYVFFLQKLQY